MTTIQWIFQLKIWKGKASSGSAAGGEGSNNMEQLPHQGSSVVETREK